MRSYLPTCLPCAGIVVGQSGATRDEEGRLQYMDMQALYRASRGRETMHLRRESASNAIPKRLACSVRETTLSGEGE